jgi:two-component system phosphate regulon response regulator PhoB
MPQTILLVEDDKSLSKLTKYNLEKGGFLCHAVYDGEEAVQLVQDKSFDLIILDIMLPGVDGLEVCRIIKRDKETANIPIIMLTAKGEETDRIVGLELGADDYMVKPFSSRELILRIKAILRRKPAIAQDDSDLLVAENLTIDISHHKVLVGGKEIELTPKEFMLLEILMRRRGRPQSRERLLEDVWDLSDTQTRTVDTHIKRLREKLGKCGEFIETVSGVGYKFSDED